MFQSDALNTHLETSPTIKTESLIFVEWNLNDPDNVQRLGNYRYRPSYSASPYYLIPASYDAYDSGNYYTGATDADVVIGSGFNQEDQPTMFVSPKEKMKMLYSLEDCIKPFRPRSGINKLLYFGNIGADYTYNQFIDDARTQIARRPRYYMASRDDQFKYWTSYRTEYGVPTPIPGFAQTEVLREVPRGFSFYDSVTGQNFIEDAAPFVVYNSTIPANKIVVKMQTNVGEVSLGNFRYGDQTGLEDPLYGDTHKTTPVKWRIEALKGASWTTLNSFDSTSTKADGTALIGPDGYVEISYGFVIPDQYKSIFVFAEEIYTTALLPGDAPEGYCYLVKSSEHDLGEMYIRVDGDWSTFIPEYSWHLSDQELGKNSNYVTKLTDPDYFYDGNILKYREFEFIDGIRIVVETMNKANCTFDLIEFSPRLVADITKMTSSFSITKVLSDLGNSSIPVGSLFAATGSATIFDIDFSFNEQNQFDPETHTGSIVSKYLNNMIKFLFYEGIRDVDGYDYFVPVKTMYAYGFPQNTSPASLLDLQLRDFFFFLEASPAPQLLMTDVSLSYAVTLLLDAIGFDNYVFYRTTTEEIRIPYFFVEQGQNVAEVLQKLAVASQTAMFFDEYNNFVVMSKEYLLPDEGDRATNKTLYGNVVGSSLPNIVSIASQDKKVYNAGQINYTTRYLQRSIGQTTSATKIDEYKNYVYKPSLLWEAPGRENRQTINELGSQSGAYTLGAIPLNSDLTDQLPYALNNNIYNNIIDVGENVYWITGYNGYFYANGEVIKYDAVEYSVAGVAGPVWITSNHQYQDYFSNLTFNGKMYPTGRIRIYTEPQFETDLSGIVRLSNANPIAKHGRGQFGTQVAYHSAGLDNDTFWKNPDNVYGCIQDASSYLFNTSKYITYPDGLNDGEAGKVKVVGTTYIDADPLAKESAVTGIIKNFLTDKNFTETELAYLPTTVPGSIQSSALVVSGPEIPSAIQAGNFTSYIIKEFFDADGAAIPYKHYGTRMRVVGKVESGTNKSQTPIGGFPVYIGGNNTTDISGADGIPLSYTAPAATTTKPDQETIINGGSGGIGVNVNKENNTGYFFEIVALTVDNIDQYNSNSSDNTISVDILSDPAPACVNNEVTAWSKNEVEFVVGQKIIVYGLSDSRLNGEFTVTAITQNKKQFKYSISEAPSISVTSTTGGVATVSKTENTNLANVFFYKVMADADGNAIPQRLWSGLSTINVDSGEFYGQSRLMGEESPTVYDLAVEYASVGTTRRFFLYINNKQVAVVDDSSPLDERNNVALFVRGSSKCMFENVYALRNNYSQSTTFNVQTGVSNIFGDDQIDATESFRKYSISGIIQKTYLSGISSMEDPEYSMYFEEFGTIMREAAYFNILYDRAYPALYAKLMKTTNNLKGYATSGFYAWSYGADFLIFNCTDFAINLDDTSGNYLKIMGAAFTQSTSYSLTVDDLYKKRSNLLDTALGKSPTLYNPFRVEEEYNVIKNSRTRFGKNEITIESPYIQSTDAAEDIFGWVISKVSVPRKMVGVSAFALQNVQLGDIVNINYVSNEGIDVIAPPTKRFVVYQIDYKKENSTSDSTIYLAEV